MNIKQLRLDLLFDTSWEVCNKVGGIYTVLSTKALTLQRLMKDKVVFIGPDVWSDDNPCPCFREVPSMMAHWKERTSLPYGISVRVGRWMVPGKPVAILVKFAGMYGHTAPYYGEMWEHFGVDSLSGYGDYDEACAFSLAAALVIESICNYKRLRYKYVAAQFEEWTTGMALLYTRLHIPYAGTIFTTHATSIGRSICGNGKELYAYMEGYHGDQMARELNMVAKHSLEKAAAHAADAFTTVSDVTARECEQLLDLRPLVTPNGWLEGVGPGKITERRLRQRGRQALLDTARALTGLEPPDDALLLVTSGRCEYRNKGIDVFLDALKELSVTPAAHPVLAFVMVPAWSKEPRADLQERLGALRKGLPAASTPLPEPYITHTLNNPGQDPVLGRIRSLAFDNVSYDQGARPFPNVQVFYVPVYLDGRDGILDEEYYNLLRSVTLTAFPSYYEPWGYTPLESVAYGVPTITTSLSGFGQWVLSDVGNGLEHSGVLVIGRDDANYPAVVRQLAEGVRRVARADDDTRRRMSAAATATAQRAAWDFFIKYYVEAWAKALAASENRRHQWLTTHPDDGADGATAASAVEED